MMPDYEHSDIHHENEGFEKKWRYSNTLLLVPLCYAELAAAADAVRLASRVCEVSLFMSTMAIANARRKVNALAKFPCALCCCRPCKETWQRVRRWTSKMTARKSSHCCVQEL